MMALQTTSIDLAVGLRCGRPLCACQRTTRTGQGRTHCPAHQDDDPSLSLGVGDDGRALWHCLASCAQEAVETALVGRGLWTARKNGANGNGHHASPTVRPETLPTVAAVPKPEVELPDTHPMWTPREDAYRYEDADGTVLYEVLRLPGKEFTQRRPGRTDGHFIPGLGSVKRVPYRLRELLAGLEVKPNRAVFIAEGEKDVNRLVQLGLVATTNSGGSKSWLPEFADYFGHRGHAVILEDNDASGRERSQRVAAMLHGKVMSVKVLALPALPTKGDISDWIDAGGTIGDLHQLVQDTPRWEPTESKEAEDRPDQKIDGVVIRFRTADAVATETPDEVIWLAQPYIPLGAVIELDGPVKRAGKTTFVMSMVRSVLVGDSFMDRPTTRTPVVYLTEQADSSLRESLRRAGLLDAKDLYLVSATDATSYPWDQVCGQVRQLALQTGSKLVVIDTLGRFSGVNGDSENDSGTAREIMAPLHAMVAEGMSVIVVRHDRKGGGEVGDSGRGSTAYAGEVDIVMRLHRLEGDVRPNARKIDCLGRYDGLPETLVVELRRQNSRDEYVALGTETDLAVQTAREAILEMLPNDGNEVEQQAVLGKEASGTKGRALKQLIEENLVLRGGKGVKGNPYRLRKPCVVTSVSSGAEPEESLW